MENSLKHIEKALVTSSTKEFLNGYMVALEGWRRGLGLSIKVKYVENLNSNLVNFVLSDDKGKEVGFINACPDINTKQALKICREKDLTKKAFIEKDIPTSVGKAFSKEETFNTIKEYANKIGYPVVMKPTNGSGGKGVITNIQNDLNLENAFKQIVKEFPKLKNLILESHFDGEDYRLYVIENKVVGVVKRVPAYIVGDGKKNISKLINEKNAERRLLAGPSNKKSIALDEELNRKLNEQNLTLSTILNKGEKLVLKYKANVSAGGESIEMSEEVPSFVKDAAIRAVGAIEGLYIAAVDIMYNEEKKICNILEINTRPGIDIQVFPTEGKQVDIPSEIIDYLFPQTKNYDRNNAYKMYFNFDAILEMTYRRSYFDYVVLTEIPEFIVLKRYFFSVEKSTGLEKKISTLAIKYQVSGNISFKNEEYCIVAAGNKNNIEKFYGELGAFLGPKVKVKEKIRTTPVMQGFRIL